MAMLLTTGRAVLRRFSVERKRRMLGHAFEPRDPIQCSRYDSRDEFERHCWLTRGIDAYVFDAVAMREMTARGHRLIPALDDISDEVERLVALPPSWVTICGALRLSSPRRLRRDISDAESLVDDRIWRQWT